MGEAIVVGVVVALGKGENEGGLEDMGVGNGEDGLGEVGPTIWCPCGYEVACGLGRYLKICNVVHNQ